MKRFSFNNTVVLLKFWNELIAVSQYTDVTNCRYYTVIADSLGSIINLEQS